MALYHSPEALYHSPKKLCLVSCNDVMFQNSLNLVNGKLSYCLKLLSTFKSIFINSDLKFNPADPKYNPNLGFQARMCYFIFH